MALLGNLTGSSQHFNDYRVYNGVATQSLRFDDGSSAYLSRTFSTPTNNKIWTFSTWVKRSNLGINYPTMFSRAIDSSNYFQLRFDLNSELITVFDKNANSNYILLQTTPKYRDTSSWYHILVAYDTTQSTSSDRVKLYVNGEQVIDFSTATYPEQNYAPKANTAGEHKIGTYSTSQHFDGYLSEVNFVDGQALTPSSFGETKNGVWVAKDTSGLTFGTNGFRLQFKQTGVGTASTSTIGADTSGNTNHWTSNSITASDCNMLDSPENNFPTFNPNNKDSATVLSEGNLKISNSTAGTVGVRSTMALPTSGKYYVEFAPTISGGNWPRAGIVRTNVAGNNPETHFDMQNGSSTNRGSSGATTGAFSTGDVGAIAFDADAGKIYLAKNNTWQNSGDPVNGTGYMFDGLTDGPFLFGNYQYHSANVMIYNFGQDSSFAGTETAQGNTDGKGIGDFYYAPPTGFLALCTANLPEPTISPNSATQADDYFNTVLYDGTGSSNSVTGVGFQPDLVAIKKRSGGSVRNSIWTDSSRGVTKCLSTSLADGEFTNSNGLTAFGADGFTVGSYNSVNESGSSDKYVSWNWKANGGTTVTNEAGSIDSTVQANTDAGFSIVTWTGTGSNATVGHALGAVPKMYIVKRLDADGHSWAVYNSNLGATKQLRLSGTNAEITTANIWNNTEPTSSVFSVGTNTDSNASSGTYVAYCFAEIEGYSKFGSYTGNGNADGTFVFTGFRPAFIICKKTSDTSDWIINDTTRDTYNNTSKRLFTNTSDAESGTYDSMDILSNGFKMRNTNSININGASYIFLAFAEAPFKYANAR